jgi:hypothetical protein
LILDFALAMPHQLISDHLSLLRSGVLLVESLPESSWLLAGPDGPSSGIAAHFRHVLEHLVCFFEACPSGLIDYDRRPRDPRIEGSRSACLELMERISACFEGLDEGSGEVPLRVVMATHPDPAVPPVVVMSSRDRELLFLLSHTIHHYALIRLILLHRDIRVPDGFGYAPSTLRSRCK